MKKLLFVVIGCILLSCASATLTEKGMAVKYVTKEEAPKSCKKINEVYLDETKFEIANSVNEVQILLRNKTAEMGGNYLVIDVIEKHTPGDGRVWYTGNGRVYKCE
jgi:hypothetical protein